MPRRMFSVAVAVLLVATAAATHAQKARLQWGPGPASLPAGARMAVVSGDPRKAGPFTVQLELPDGFTVRPHFHPADEHQTVISGRIGHGFGDTIDVKSMKWLRPGQSGVFAANAHHYAMTRGRTVVRVSSVGPLTVTYVNPEDDPRKRER
jgi:hypothetical protein